MTTYKEEVMKWWENRDTADERWDADLEAQKNRGKNYIQEIEADRAYKTQNCNLNALKTTSEDLFNKKLGNLDPLFNLDKNYKLERKRLINSYNSNNFNPQSDHTIRVQVKRGLEDITSQIIIIKTEPDKTTALINIDKLFKCLQLSVNAGGRTKRRKTKVTKRKLKRRRTRIARK